MTTASLAVGKLRSFRVTIFTIALLALIFLTLSSLIGIGFESNGGKTLTEANLAGIVSLFPGVLIYAGVGLLMGIGSFYFIGRLIGLNLKANLATLVNHENDDSVFLLAKDIAFASALVAVTVAPKVIAAYITVLIAKLVILLGLAIIITALLGLLIMRVAEKAEFGWHLDAWWIHHVSEKGSDMVARMTGISFQLVAIAIFGVWLVSHL